MSFRLSGTPFFSLFRNVRVIPFDDVLVYRQFSFHILCCTPRLFNSFHFALNIVDFDFVCFCFCLLFSFSRFFPDFSFSSHFYICLDFASSFDT
jgi:hypothetical protein